MTRVERRAVSVFLPFKGDYLDLKGKKIHRALTKKFNEKRIVFSDKVKKVNVKYDVQTRTLVITETAIYNIGGLFNKVHRYY